jgi:hypothetical protein
MLPQSLAGGDHWRLTTPKGVVHVWRPAGYGGNQAVLYVHGYYTTVDEAWSGHRLASQFAASGTSAVFIAPEAPVGNEDGVKWTDLSSLVVEVSRQTGIMLGAPYHAIGHSGAYRTIARWLSTPGLQKITLLDALYGNVADFARWASGPGRKLVTLALPNGPPFTNSMSIANKPGVTFLKGQGTHMGLVTSGAFIPKMVRAMGNVASGTALVLVVAIGAAAYLLWR